MPGQTEAPPAPHDHEFRGNRLLKLLFEAVLDARHPWVPPILHFIKPRSGQVEFTGLCVLERLELTSSWTRAGR